MRIVKLQTRTRELNLPSTRSRSCKPHLHAIPEVPPILSNTCSNHGQGLANPTYMRLRKSHPFLATRAATNVTEPPINAVPPNTCAYRNPPSFLWISAPASGGPVRQAIETTVKHMPVRTPIFLRSVVRLAHAAGKRLCTPAAKKP